MSLWQMPQFHSIARFSEHSEQGGSEARNLYLILSLTTISTARSDRVRARLQLSARLCVTTPHAPSGRPLTWSLGMALSCTGLPCPGKPIQNFLASMWSPAGELRTTVCIFLAQNPGRKTLWPSFILLKLCPPSCNEDGGIGSFVSLASCLTHKMHFHVDTEFRKLEKCCVLLNFLLF